jgi:hypothetical protein
MFISLLSTVLVKVNLKLAPSQASLKVPKIVWQNYKSQSIDLPKIEFSSHFHISTYNPFLQLGQPIKTLSKKERHSYLCSKIY